MAQRSSASHRFDSPLLPAIMLSLGLHVAGIALLHPFKTDSMRLEKPLEIVLEPPKPEAPKPPPPEPKPEPPKPEPKPLPKKALPPPPVKTVIPDRPITPPPAEASPTPPPQVISAAPSKDAEPTFTAPPAPEPVKQKDPPPVDIDADLGAYGNLLAREFAKHKQYPRIAQMRGWQGTVRIKLDVDANGNVTGSIVSESSGYETLDKQALEMAKKASPLPTPPEALRHRPFTVTVPVLFRLE